MPVNLELFQPGPLGHRAQFGNAERTLARGRGVELGDGIGQITCQKFARPDRDAISPQVVHDVADAGNLMDAPQDCNHVGCGEVMQRQRTEHDIKTAGRVRQGEQIVLLEADVRKTG